METMLDEELNLDSIDECRLCGIYYIKKSNFLRNLFCAPVDDPQMHQIRQELAAWKLDIKSDDGRPQNICIGCINEFQRVFKFRESCLETQRRFEYFEHQQQMNKAVTIKTELSDPDEQNICGFIYIDDLSDTEDDGQYEGSLVPSFDRPHIPIKEEHFEEAKVPNEINNLPSTMVPDASVCTELPAILKTEIKSEGLEASPLNAFDVTSDSCFNLINLCADEDDDVQIVKFTYDHADEGVEEVITLKNESKSSSSKENESVCKFCLYVAKDPEALRLHVKRIHDVRDLECHICGKAFKNSTASRLKFHVKWHKLSKHIKCNQCGFYCTSREVLNEHKRAMHSKIKCNICGKRMLAKRLKGHLREHEHVGTLRCSLCPKVFDNQLLYEAHVTHSHCKTEAATDQTPHNSFDTSRMSVELEQNESQSLDITDESEPSHHSGALIIRDCSGTPAEIKHHPENMNHATESESNKLNDSSFATAFDTLDTLSAHSDLHEDPNVVCHICGKTFDLTFKLNRHIQKHTKSLI